MWYVKKYEVGNLVIADTESDEVERVEGITHPVVGCYAEMIKPASAASVKAMKLLDFDSVGVKIEHSSSIFSYEDFLMYDGDYNFYKGGSYLQPISDYLNIGDIAIKALSGKTDILTSQFFIMDDMLHVCIDFSDHHGTYLTLRVLDTEKLRRIAVKHDVLFG